jgi:acyl carrier protein
MKKEEILEKVIRVIADSCGLDIGTIRPESTLFDELAVNSIDMVDILYTLEMEYDISLKISDLEKEARTELKGLPFEIDNVITDEGLKVLHNKLPEIPVDKMEKGLTVNGIIRLFTVQTLTNMLMLKIKEKELG